MKTILSLFLLGLLSLAPQSAGAQQPAESASYPARPVKVIVPNAAGGARGIIGGGGRANVRPARRPPAPTGGGPAQKLAEPTGGQFYVENVPGAGGIIGMGAAAKAPADG